MTISQPAYPISTTGLVDHVGTYTDQQFARFVGSQPVAAPWSPLDNTSAATFSANNVKLARAVVPTTGTLKDFSVYVTTSSGNLMGLVYDCGDTTLGSYTLLWSSGSVACPTTGTPWRVLASPDLAVTAGKHLLLGVIADNATVQLAGRVTSPGTQTNVGNLPASFLPVPGAVSPKLTINYGASSFSPPASFTDAAAQLFAVGGSGSPGSICRIV